MQPVPPPLAPPYRNRFGLLLLIGAIVIAAVAGVGGYLIGHAGLADATILVNVQNRAGENLTSVQILLNGVVQTTVSIPNGQTVQVTLHVSYATANGAYEDISAVSSLGPNDSSRVLVNAVGTYVVNLRLG